MDRLAIGGGLLLSAVTLSVGTLPQIPPESSQAKLPSDIEAIYEQLIQQAQTKASSGQVDQAVADIASIPPNSKHYQEARQLQDGWSKDLLVGANRQYQQAKLTEAIAQLRAIPPGSPSFEQAKPLIETWSQQEQLLARATQSADQGNWKQAVEALNNLRNTELYNTPQIQALAQKAITNAFGSDIATARINRTEVNQPRPAAATPRVAIATPNPAPELMASAIPSEQQQLATTPRISSTQPADLQVQAVPVQSEQSAPITVATVPAPSDQPVEAVPQADSVSPLTIATVSEPSQSIQPLQPSESVDLPASTLTQTPETIRVATNPVSPIASEDVREIQTTFTSSTPPVTEIAPVNATESIAVNSPPPSTSVTSVSPSSEDPAINTPITVTPDTFSDEIPYDTPMMAATVVIPKSQTAPITPSAPSSLETRNFQPVKPADIRISPQDAEMFNQVDRLESRQPTNSSSSRIESGDTQSIPLRSVDLRYSSSL
jgi:hypothetical protein